MSDKAHKRHDGEMKQPGSHRRPLVCPHCRAKYTPSTPTAGRRVRCYHCGHVWRDEKKAVRGVANALNKAASAWSDLGSTVIGAANHASTMGHLVSKSIRKPKPPAGDWVGRRLGRYQIKAVLGQGAMGYVYEALDCDLKRTVALKLLPQRAESEASSPGLRMFLQEAKIAAQLQHPNIVTIYEIGQDDGLHFFAMERVHGVTLLQLVRERGPLPASQACYIIAHAARALAVGHAMGVVHRDVKPGNIMIDTEGRVKVTDFGLADIEGVSIGGDSLRHRALGTPGWISPEVAREEQATPASDIYGLGLTLYYVLTGKRLIKVGTPQEMIRKQKDARSVQREDLPEAWPPRLRDVVVQCLQVDPHHRYQSADTLAADLLRAIAPDQTDTTMVLGREPRRASPQMSPAIRWATLLALALISLAVAGWYFFSP